MSWTAVDLTQDANNLDWGTSNLGGITTVSTVTYQEPRLSASVNPAVARYPASLSTILYVPGATDGYMPELVRPVAGPLEAVGGGGGSTRPTTGMIYPRGQG